MSNRVKAIRLHETGGPDKLKLESVELPSPEPGMATVRHAAVGVNFIDTYHRSGLYPLPLPSGLGLEAAGVIEAVGEGVNLNVGDRVCYFAATLGAYSEAANQPAHRLVRLPDSISFEQAAASALKGATVELLVRRVHALKSNEYCLFHAAAGGVGSLFGQWAKAIGAIAIGTVGSDEKMARARELGYQHVINYRTEDVVARVKEITNNKGVAVVYDGIGRDTFDVSLDSLQPRGLMVSFGNASGPPEPFLLQTLALKGSLFITRPSLMDYVIDDHEMHAAISSVFDQIITGNLKIEIGQRYSLADIAQAHHDLEASRTLGACLVTP